jgi:hypothetical protein
MTRRLRHRSLRVAGAAVVVTGVVGAVVIAGSSAAGAAVTVPYTDLSSKGTITLCDAKGNAVTAGSIDDKPFVLKASSTVPAPAPYGGQGRTATLLAYQPSKTTYPDQWSGDTLTAASQYTDPQHPMAVATPLDFTLAQYLKEFPARWDGFVQLRMYFGAKGQGVGNDSYPTTDLRIVGHTWTVVRGGSGNCTQGSAVSNEVAIAHVPGASASPTAPRSTVTSAAQATASASATAGAPSTGATPGDGGGQAGAQTPPVSTRSNGMPAWVPALVALLLLAIAGLLIFLRRDQDPSATTR